MFTRWECSCIFEAVITTPPRQPARPSPGLFPLPPEACAWLAGLLLCLCPGLVPGAESGLKVGDKFPSLAEAGLEGELPGVLTGKVVVVYFWASWCSPCRPTFPLIEELHHRFGKKNLVVLAVNEDKSRGAMAEFLKEYPVTFAVVRDARKQLASTVNVPVLPCAYVLDGRGQVHSIISGERIARDRRAFRKEIEDLLAQQSNPTP